MINIGLIKRFYEHIDSNLRMMTFGSLIWLVDIVPKAFGFPIGGDKIHALFWVVHWTVLMYVYALGNVVYQIKFADGTDDIIKGLINITLTFLIGSVSWWWISKKASLKKAVTIMEKSDQLAHENQLFQDNYNQRITRIKKIVIAFFTFEILSATVIYMPHRVDVNADYSMAICVGMEPLTKSPNLEICVTLLLIQEITNTLVVHIFQALLVCLVGHTAIMYHKLSLEMLNFNNYRDINYIKESASKMLPSFIRRHTLILDAFESLKDLYSFPIGVNFATNAICMALFFFLSLSEWPKFLPVLGYCFVVLFLYCFLCQKLTDAADEFERAVYSCGWENFDVQEKKMVYVMLIQAQRPVIILAADIIPVNMDTFATTMQGLYKFVTVMKF